MTTPAQPPAKPGWEAIAGPIADMAVAYYEANEAALAPIIAKLESEGEGALAAGVAKVFTSKSVLLAGLEKELSAGFVSAVDAAVAQYGAPTVVLALIDKELHYAATALGG